MTSVSKTEIDKFIPIVLCAGFGTRLKPLTNYIPKVVCPIINKPAAFINIEIFFKFGFPKVYCNTHYLDHITKQEIILAAKFYGYDPARIEFFYEEEILETGGGIARIFHELSKNNKKNSKRNVIVVSGDIIANFPIQQMIKAWQNKNCEDYALMCTKKINFPRKDTTWISKDSNYIQGFGENFLLKNASNATVFTNHQIIGYELLNQVPIEKKSSIEIYYKNAITQDKKVINLNYPKNKYWFDIGTPKSYKECLNFFENKLKPKKQNYFQNNLINFCFQSPNFFKDKLNLYETKELSPNNILISFRDIDSNLSSKKIFNFDSNQTEYNFSFLL
ncbi:NDP-sugar synthase [Spirobacillus cienkowskii]|uniref:nucleotidyltransferase family protein n=1 Tax=Spirobacillus cienkowskii TaxID=495820 RepID=UPI0030D5700A